MVIEEEKFFVSEDYELTFRAYKVDKVKLRLDEKEAFSKLASKSKMSWLNYIKEERALEKSLSDIVNQSKYLYLLKDSSGFHLRISDSIPEGSVDMEGKLITEIKDRYSSHLSEDVNYGMSNDINRLLISKGKLIDES